MYPSRPCVEIQRSVFMTRVYHSRMSDGMLVGFSYPVGVGLGCAQPPLAFPGQVLVGLGVVAVFVKWVMIREVLVL